MEQTPIEMVIEKLRILNNDQWSPKLTDTIKYIRKNVLPYEKTFHRNIAEKAWDECRVCCYQNSEITYDFVEFDHTYIEKDKQTYLNQNHPLC